MHYIMTIQYSLNKTTGLLTHEGVIELAPQMTRQDYYTLAYGATLRELTRKRGIVLCDIAVTYFQLEPNTL